MSAPSPPAPPRAHSGAWAWSAARSAAMVNAGMILASGSSASSGRTCRRTTSATSAYPEEIAAAFRVGNITQNLLGERTLAATFIPVSAKLRAAGKQEEAKHFALAALGLLLVVVGVASALGAAGAPWLAWLIAAGFDAERLDGTARLVRVVFPMTGLLVLSAWALGVLNAHRRFFLPYAAPVLWSVAQIVGLWGAARFLGAHGEGLALALGWSAVAGALLQLVVLLPAARSLLGGLRPRLDAKDPSVREAARRLPGVLLGRGVIQISGLVDMLLVSFLGTGANAAFNYAQSIYLFPMSLLGTGEAAVALPEMAGDTAELDLEKRNAKLRARLGASLLATPHGREPARHRSHGRARARDDRRAAADGPLRSRGGLTRRAAAHGVRDRAPRQRVGSRAHDGVLCARRHADARAVRALPRRRELAPVARPHAPARRARRRARRRRGGVDRERRARVEPGEAHRRPRPRAGEARPRDPPRRDHGRAEPRGARARACRDHVDAPRRARVARARGRDARDRGAGARALRRPLDDAARAPMLLWRGCGVIDSRDFRRDARARRMCRARRRPVDASVRSRAIARSR